MIPIKFIMKWVVGLYAEFDVPAAQKARLKHRIFERLPENVRKHLFHDPEWSSMGGA